MGRQPDENELSRIYAQYLLHLADDIGHAPGYRVFPGAVATLNALVAAGVTLGLVSGAMEGAARTKLVPADLNRFFIFGAYGSDSPDRGELTKLAVEKARRLHDRFSADRVLVVGDTPRDIEAAQAADAVSVGVATGKYSVDELKAAGADHVLTSLEETFPGLEPPGRLGRHQLRFGVGALGILLEAGSQAREGDHRGDGHDDGHAVEHAPGGVGEVESDEVGDRS